MAQTTYDGPCSTRVHAPNSFDARDANEDLDVVDLFAGARSVYRAFRPGLKSLR